MSRNVRETSPRRLTDPKEMRAVAHPVRLALLEALVREGPLTATQAAALIGETPANCSFHFRTLAKYGFVEEAEGGTGRQRPWRRVHLGQSFTEEQDTPEASHAAQALAAMSHERVFDRIRAYQENRSSYPAAWREVAFGDNTLAYVTPAELEEIERDILVVLRRYIDRSVDPATRPADSMPVSLSAFGHPVPPLRPPA